jgi:N-acetylglucosamine kinase-like BadF-type ATPase
VSHDGPVARRLGTLAPLVLDAAQAGDVVARGIAHEAVRLLTASAVAASARTADVVVHGGLTGHAWFRAELGASLAAAGRIVVAARGDALDGAALLAARADLPHERFVHRAD